MTTIEKITAALKEHGPMTPAQLTEKLPSIDYLATYLSQYSRSGRLAKKGSGAKAIYSIGTGKPAKSAPPQRRKKPKKAERAKPAAKPAKKANGHDDGFVAAITHDRRLLIVDEGRPGVFTAEQTNAIADVILTNFEQG